MKICPNCHQQLDDSCQFCVSCGVDVSAVPSFDAQNNGQYQQNTDANNNQYQQPYQQPVVPDFDHTAEYDVEDIRENKLFAMFAHLCGFMGIIVALLACKDSGFVKFHIKQSLKIEIAAILVAIISALLCWTFIVPIAGAVFFIIFFVLKIILFFQAASGKAKEPAIIRGLNFLK